MEVLNDINKNTMVYISHMLPSRTTIIVSVMNKQVATRKRRKRQGTIQYSGNQQ